MFISPLFHPIRIGDITLSRRVVLPPLARLRNAAEHVPTELGVEHYARRVSVPGRLLVTEGMYISPQEPGGGEETSLSGYLERRAGRGGEDGERCQPLSHRQTLVFIPHTQISEAGHAKGSYIYLQLWVMGRAARSELLRKENPGFIAVAPSRPLPSPSPPPLMTPRTS